MLYGYMIFTHSQLLISRGRWSIVDLHDLIPDLIFQLSIVAVHVCVCVRFICKLTEVYSLHFISSETTKMQSQSQQQRSHFLYNCCLGHVLILFIFI